MDLVDAAAHAVRRELVDQAHRVVLERGLVDAQHAVARRREQRRRRQHERAPVARGLRLQAVVVARASASIGSMRGATITGSPLLLARGAAPARPCARLGLGSLASRDSDGSESIGFASCCVVVRWHEFAGLVVRRPRLRRPRRRSAPRESRRERAPGRVADARLLGARCARAALRLRSPSPRATRAPAPARSRAASHACAARRRAAIHRSDARRSHDREARAQHQVHSNVETHST